jgi:hypothetical protein
VEYVQANGRSARYFYAVISLLIDQSEQDILYSTVQPHLAPTIEDDNVSWDLLANDEEEYAGGVFLCKPRQGCAHVSNC